MKVAIVTLCGNYNLGNRLQNYALQQELKKLDNETYNIDTFHRKKSVKRIIKKILSLTGNKIQKAYFRREKLFNIFNNNYIENSISTTYKTAFNKDWSEFDAFVTGSDQVWHNWNKSQEELEFFYLEFVEEKKRISYAPSFGFDNFNENDVSIHKNGINGINYLSCREKSGCDLIYELTNRTAINVIDPTLLLGQDEWTKIAIKPDYTIPENYILVYCLGDITEEGKSCINAAEKKYNAKVVNIYDKRETKYYCTDPSRFIYLVKYAKCICTDSFHGTVFSLIFNKQFITMLRPISEFNASSDRIYDLLNELKLKTRIYEKNFDDYVIDYAPINKRIEEWKGISVEYLKDALLNVSK